MPRYKLWIEYEGTAYCGWQSQPDQPTVQDEVEKAFRQIFQEKISVYGQGRTDSGVHALGQTAHVDLPENLDLDKAQYSLNGVLPDDIAVWQMEEAADDFHARFDATARQYCYRITQRPHPLYRRTTEKILQEIDRQLLDRCAEWVEGEHDFESFTKTSDEQPSARCTIELSAWEQNAEDLLIYRIRANRFVRHLVRRLVGTMLRVATHRMEANEFQRLLHNPDPKEGGYSAPPKGLILEKVWYE